ncbi:hypothetical protein KA111_01890 [Candidatus Woesebacteria bacterium]|nr:hypothetical protein [Candidatus Woesebacteria bacterium]
MLNSETLRKDHPKFIFENYNWELIESGSDTDSTTGATTGTTTSSDLKLTFKYKIEPDISFSPTLIIKNVNQTMISSLGSKKINNYVFNIGLAEMLSYWKSTTSPVIEIKAGNLSDEQIIWWKKLLIKGMGEFFFVNNIDFTQEDFVKISCTFSDEGSDLLNESTADKPLVSTLEPQSTDVESLAIPLEPFTSTLTELQATKEKILIPVGGGKDSAVTLEILGNHNDDVGTFTINPTPAAIDLIRAKNINNNINVERNLDPKIIELNNQGYLNGHVPISALFAFTSVFSADLFGYTHIAISNERSSNEGNVEFLGQQINHQYSKTFEFEEDFQNYIKKYFDDQAPFYFSFLRPLFELQIAQIFSGKTESTSEMEKFHPIFRSCNRGQKTNSWCGECSKCLFAYIILFPFLSDEKIISYFDKNMFEDEKLWPIAQELIGIGAKKPLDCVGTHEESIVAFYLSIKKYQKSGQKLPLLLEIINNEFMKNQNDLENRTNLILNAWNDENSVPVAIAEILKEYVK